MSRAARCATTLLSWVSVWVIVVSAVVGIGIGFGYRGITRLLSGSRSPREPSIPPARTANAGRAARAKAWIKQRLPGGARTLAPVPATMKRAIVYRRKGLFLLHAESRSTAGMWILGKPVLGIEDTRDDRELGLALRAALDGSRSGVREPRRWDAQTKPLLRLAGAKTWNGFAKSAIRTGVHEEDERIALVPTWHGGPMEGFVDTPEKKVILERATPEELGAALRLAMS